MTTIDLRSDTVTQPTPAMRHAMMEAPLGDDVLGDEPTVQALESHVAVLLGKEAALFVPSGTMANQLAIRIHTQPGDEIIAHLGSHVYQYETGAPAALSGCTFAFANGPRGLFTPGDLDDLVRPNDHHFPPSRLVVVENTHNKGGGAVWPIDQLSAVCARAEERGIARHLDGARLWNACAATGLPPADYAAHFDTVSCCFSKGLGAPVGSALAGPADLIHRARRFRKMFGGAMRQSGILAAAAFHALDHHMDRLADDHANAKRLAEGLSQIKGITIDLDEVETNIVYFDVDHVRLGAQDLCETLDAKGVRMLATGPNRVRAVTNLMVSADMVEPAIQSVARALA